MTNISRQTRLWEMCYMRTSMLSTIHLFEDVP